MIRFNLRIAKLIREVQFYSPWKHYFFPKYDYNFTPPQLLFLCECLEETKDLSGSVAEVGCAGGKTAIFLNKYMSAREINKSYFAIDTFSGFVKEDVEYEVSNRGKNANQYRGFRLNSKKWFDGTMKLNSIDRVVSMKADINYFDFSSLGPLAFVLLDVDLYRPIKKGLEELYQLLAPGGVIIVDDCNPGNSKWDGSRQAYKEFVKELKLPELIIHEKLGVIRKPL